MVYKGYDLQEEKHVALKRIHLEIEEEGIPQTSLREFAYLKSLQSKKHPNIVILENIIIESKRLYLVFELLEGSMLFFLKRDNICI